MNSLCIQGDNRHSVGAWERSPRQCSVMLPDGSCSSVTLRSGSLIREVLQDLCQNIGVNIAAVDLFLVGGEKVRREWVCCRASSLLFQSEGFWNLIQLKEQQLVLELCWKAAARSSVNTSNFEMISTIVASLKILDFTIKRGPCIGFAWLFGLSVDQMILVCNLWCFSLTSSAFGVGPGLHDPLLTRLEAWEADLV